MSVELPTILVVEDEATLRVAYRELLPIFGFRVVVVATGHDAIELAADPDAQIAGALVDWDLPDMQGTQAIVGMRAHRPSLPALVCTGAITPECQQQVDALPQVAVIQKGSGVDKLRQALQSMVLTGN